MSGIQSDPTAGPVQYAAKRVGPPPSHSEGGALQIVADGKNTTSGYRTGLREAGDLQGTPIFVLENIRPSGSVEQVITPFHVEREIVVMTNVSSVKVRDHYGEHDVSVAPNSNPGPLGPRN